MIHHPPPPPSSSFLYVHHLLLEYVATLSCQSGRRPCSPDHSLIYILSLCTRPLPHILSTCICSLVFSLFKVMTWLKDRAGAESAVTSVLSHKENEQPYTPLKQRCAYVTYHNNNRTLGTHVRILPSIVSFHVHLGSNLLAIKCSIVCSYLGQK